MQEIRFSGESSTGYEGLTLRQVCYLGQQFFGMNMVCLLAAGRPKVSTKSISQVVTMAPDDLVGAMKSACLDGRVSGVNTLFVYDRQMAHCVAAKGWEGDGPLFWDGWSGRSLLCAENNIAGVEAEARPHREWWVPAEQMARVIFAWLVFPDLWGEITGVPTCRPLEDFRQSDFFSWFGVTEVDREPAHPGTKIHLKTGGFQEETDIEIDLDVRERVISAELQLRRSWIVWPPYGLNPFARDLAKSFISDFVPVQDRENAQPLIAAIEDGLSAKETGLELIKQASPTGSILRSFVMADQDGAMYLPNSSIRGGTLDRGGEPWFRLTVITGW